MKMLILKWLFVIVALCFVSACDDDEKKNKKPKYEVTIYVSDHIQGEIVVVPAERRFAKPRIVVQAPEGVKVEHDETKPRKNIVYDFEQTTIRESLILSLGTSSCIGLLLALIFYLRRLTNVDIVSSQSASIQ